MPFPRRLLTEDEEIVREFRQHWKLILIPALWAIAVAIGFYFLVFRLIDNSTVDLVVGVAAVIILVILAVRPMVSWWFTWYVLTTERLITRSGIVAREGIDIPLENVNNVIFSQSFLERILGSGDLVVESAGATGQSHFANIRQPDEFQALLYKTREQRAKVLEMGLHEIGAPGVERRTNFANFPSCTGTG